jgi:Rrf2 family protein
MAWSQTAEYAMRAAVCLAGRPGESLSTEAIAGATHVPRDYLSKVLQALVRARILQSRRGLGGGFVLARDPGAVTALDVVNAVDPVRRIRQCPLGFAAHGRQLCALHRRMDAALADLEAALGETRLADIVHSGQTGLCPQRRDLPVPVELRRRPRRRGRRPVRRGAP